MPNILTGWTSDSLTPLAGSIAATAKKTFVAPKARSIPELKKILADDQAQLAKSLASGSNGEGERGMAAWPRAEDDLGQEIFNVSREIREREQPGSVGPDEVFTPKVAARDRFVDKTPFTLAKVEWNRTKQALQEAQLPVAERNELQKQLSVDFKNRYPSFEFSDNPLTFNKDRTIYDSAVAEGTAAAHGNAVTGGGGGGGGGGTASLQSDVVGGAGPAFNAGQVAGRAGGPSLSGPSSGWTSNPVVAPVATPIEPPPAGGSASSAPTLGGGGGGASPTSRYNLSNDDLSGGPDPRTAVAQGTPLETLLRSIYPDAPITGADPTADPRSAGPGPSAFNDIISYLLNQNTGGGSGYVQAPQLVGPSAGANLAATIPGAPSWLGPQINNLPSGGGFVQAPQGGGGGGNTLQGLAAISAEQRLQQAQIDAKRKQDEALYFEMREGKRVADNKAAQDQYNRGTISGPGWTDPNTESLFMRQMSARARGLPIPYA